ncbi:adenylate/guanylate cyclase domain-containing protein [Rhodococcus chondri]|uniref:Adenylate/guanylate cyclase domain-containing protein n=1 Tax=Rhodococcus chondri TaxID=3065941 RepID=A0ABU7JSR9_9NOCA|nr:adenylate/guanylate cyclase domain-containing protein [Rhodococcus sp. CC-R104]MEE2032337.1 adenylate/guanylate cyclase domain-containing protein [Rhodococcus sp. CC-R104]
MNTPEPHSPSGSDLFAEIQEELERSLLGGPRRYTVAQVAEMSGMTPVRVRRLWQALGFTVDPEPDAKMFTDGDVDALCNIAAIIGSGAIDETLELSAARSLGQSISRLAEWQLTLFNTHMFEQLLDSHAGVAPDEMRKVIDELVQRMSMRTENLQSYVWRRHLVATTERSIVRPQGSAPTRDVVVGFADMVGYTQLTRRIDAGELNELLEYFESEVTAVIAAHHGWVIKTVGDEVMFATDEPADGARIAIGLQETFGASQNTPALRVGLAWGPALARFGDLFGSVVNNAARLTGAARPGAILVDEKLAAELGDDEFRVQPLRRLRVKDFRRSRPYVLRPAGNGSRGR